MSTELDIFSIRLREEFERTDLSLAEAARRAGEKDSGRLKQIVSGRQRCPIELLSAFDAVGVDVYYVVTGKRGSSARKGSVDLALVVRIASLVESALTKHRARLSLTKKEEFVRLLYDHFALKGGVEKETIERHLKLVINQ